MENDPAGRPSGFTLHSLIPLEDFKVILGVDDRDNDLCWYCLVTATYTIEQYCKRRLIRKKHTDYHTFSGQHIFTLREYPVRRVLSVHAITSGSVQQGHPLFDPENLVHPDNYFCLPDEGSGENIPFSLILRPLPRLSREGMFIKVRYATGYVPGKVPVDLASACLELAAWNMARYRRRRIGMTGNVRGNGKDGEHPEASMPENVRLLLEPYRRRTI
jgi:hypothetical protein